MIITKSNPEEIQSVLKSLLRFQDGIKSLAVRIDSSPWDKADWPLAVEPTFLINEQDELQKISRAEAVVDLFIREPVQGLSILDYGCGEGHVAVEMAKRGAKVIAYDPAYVGKFTEAKFVSSQEEAFLSGPYDIILLFDVLDHVMDVEPSEILKKCAGALKPGGRILCRYHPWCSRHGTHIFHKTNKAFLHLIFDEQLLVDLGSPGIPTRKVIHPRVSYKSWAADAGLKYTKFETQRQTVEEFFKSHQAWIVNHWRSSKIDAELAAGRGWPDYAMEQNFVDTEMIVDG